MIERRRQIQVTLHLIGDLVAIGLTVPLAYWLRFHLEIVAITKGVPDWEHYLILVPMALVIWPAVFYFQGLYQRR